jgi:hypothetical protein
MQLTLMKPHLTTACTPACICPPRSHHASVNFIIVVAITETTKSFSGELRPDFLARCQPAPPDGSPPGDAANHISDAAVRMGAVHIGEIARCTNTHMDTVKQGRFVSNAGAAALREIGSMGKAAAAAAAAAAAGTVW